MSDHDPLCPWDTEDWRGDSRRCECALIARVVEREARRWEPYCVPTPEEFEARVRADEHRKSANANAVMGYMRGAVDEALADLRANVERWFHAAARALELSDYRDETSRARANALHDVLALIDLAGSADPTAQSDHRSDKEAQR